MMEYTVEVKDLTRKFGDFTAVNSISFSVTRGEIFGFLGPNGAGKSTTIKMLCGIILPTFGEGHVYGYDIVREQEIIKNNIGYMSQKFSLYDDLTVVENLEFYGSIYGLSGRRLRDRMEYALSLAEIDEDRNAIVSGLPMGIKQRLALGAAILHDPPMLFLDEPTSGVDPIMRRNFWEIIYRFSEEGKTIFVTTHYMEEAEHCDRIALVINGGIIALDSPSRLKSGLPYSVYSLQVENFIRVFERISMLDFIRDSAIFGSDIHILCDEGVQVKRLIAGSLGEMGIDSFRLQRIAPTLEDVFVTNARKYGL
jgi:ABC-2 type transport system ATP-binding protein